MSKYTLTMTAETGESVTKQYARKIDALKAAVAAGCDYTVTSPAGQVVAQRDHTTPDGVTGEQPAPEPAAEDDGETRVVYPAAVGPNRSSVPAGPVARHEAALARRERVQAEAKAPKVAKAPAAPKAPKDGTARQARTFDPALVTEYRCAGACGEVLPVSSFPTVAGGTKRGVECRKDRNARVKAAKESK